MQGINNKMMKKEYIKLVVVFVLIAFGIITTFVLADVDELSQLEGDCEGGVMVGSIEVFCAIYEKKELMKLGGCWKMRSKKNDLMIQRILKGGFGNEKI